MNSIRKDIELNRSRSQPPEAGRKACAIDQRPLETSTGGKATDAVEAG